MIPGCVLVFFIDLYSLINNLCIKCLGISPRDGYEAEQGIDRGNCAHRQRILLRSGWRISSGHIRLDKDFALIHQSWENPEKAILNDKCVNLMGLDTEHAFFAVLPEDVDSYDGAFMYVTYVQRAIEVITLPLKDFVKLSDKLPESKVLLLSNTSRCGSTLLTKMLQRLDGVIAMSEPDFLTQISHFENGKLLSQPVKDVLRAGFKLQCKEPGKKLWVIKPQSFIAGLIPAIAEACPHVHHVFIMRHPRTNIPSIINMFNVFAGGKPLHTFQPLHMLPAIVSSILLEGMANKEVFYEVTDAIVEQKFPEVQLATLFWALHILNYKECKDKLSIDILPLMYEDLLADPTRTISDILSHCQVQFKSDMSKVLEVMNTDSQENSRLSWKAVRKIEKTKRELSSQDWQIAEEMLDKLGLPKLDSFMDIFQENSL